MQISIDDINLPWIVHCLEEGDCQLKMRSQKKGSKAAASIVGRLGGDIVIVAEGGNLTEALNRLNDTAKNVDP